MVVCRQKQQAGRWVIALAFLCFTIGLRIDANLAPVHAGVGPENCLIVVNARSSVSRRIANHYIQLRQIHPKNVLLLDGVPLGEECSAIEFKTKIMTPILDAISERKLDRQIDCIIYSTGFPARVNFTAWAAKVPQKLGKHQTPTASITSLTYLYRYAISESPAIIDLDVNLYARRRPQIVLDFPVSQPEQQAAFAAAKTLYDEEQFAEAAAAFGTLLAEQPFQCGLAYWQCRCWSKAGDKSAAVNALMTAIQRGWKFKQFTENDPALAAIKDFAPATAALKSIDEPFWELTPPSAFSARVVWSPSSFPERADLSANAYLLCSMLGFHGQDNPNANTEQEILDYLSKSVAADGKRPQGKFVFAETKDVRTTTRRGNFPAAIAALEALGFETVTVNSNIPGKAIKVLGATIGIAKIDWARTGGEFQPGAICDNLTSYGARFDAGNRQSTVAHFLRNGACAASGTVVEPYAIQNKFPLPLQQAYYAKGFSMIEAFYMSVTGPFQLLVLGDPMCQPYAQPPQFDLKLNVDTATVKGSLPVQIELKPNSPPLSRIEFFFDGMRITPIELGRAIRLDTTRHADGYHELRFVAYANDSTEASSRVIVPLVFNNRNHHVTMTAAVKEEFLKVNVMAEGADSVQIFSQNQLLQESDTVTGQFSFPNNKLGRGPVTVQVIAKFGEEAVASTPALVNVLQE